jgi:tRNA-guanine family transglycosylase
VFSSNHNRKNPAKGTAPKPNGYTFSDGTSPDPWLLDYTRITVPTFDPVQDAIQFAPKKAADTTTITSSTKHVMVWTENGRQTLTPELYYNAAGGLKSQATVSLFDVCLSDSSQRRRRAALERTAEWGSEMIKRGDNNAQKDSENWMSFLIAPTAEDEKDREAEQLAATIEQALDANKISGVSFVGWQYASDSEQQKALLQKSIQSIHLKSPDTKKLAVLSTNSLTQFLDAACLGINVIGTNLPAKWAKGKKALACDYSYPPHQGNKRAKAAEDHSFKQGLDENGCFYVLSGNAEDGKGGAWIRDTRSVFPGCSCLTCQRHSRAYIYHLVMTKELLAEILLFVHNLHHMLNMTNELSRTLNGGTQEEFRSFINKQLNWE